MWLYAQSGVSSSLENAKYAKTKANGTFIKNAKQK